MRRLILGFFVFACACPLISAAEPINRREAFVLIWNAIKRPVEATRETPFTDVPKGDAGFEIITYAKARGLLDDVPEFHPRDPLTLQAALLMLFRTRNVDDIDVLTMENLPTLLERYPLVTARADGFAEQLAKKLLTSDELESLMTRFDQMLDEEDHEVSLYSEKFHGKGTAFGETFDMYAMTAAHRTFPHNTIVKVTNIENGKSVTVRINDRGPYVKGRDLDLSLGAFTTIAERSKGKIRAVFERLGDVSLISSAQEPVPVASSSSVSSLSSSSVPVSHCADARMQVRAGRVILRSGVPTVFSLGEELRLDSTKPFMVNMLRLPTGARTSIGRTFQPGDAYTFTPDEPGTYRFQVGGVSGGLRWFSMEVKNCSS